MATISPRAGLTPPAGEEAAYRVEWREKLESLSVQVADIGAEHPDPRDAEILATAADALSACALDQESSFGDGVIAEIAAERRRQVEQEGWTPAHDDHHGGDFALPRAAACYAIAGTAAGNGPFWITHLQTPQQVWPYRWEWKPKSRRENLIRASALLIAEIERVDRAQAEESSHVE